jgi:hypothetical protein
MFISKASTLIKDIALQAYEGLRKEDGIQSLSRGF